MDSLFTSFSRKKNTDLGFYRPHETCGDPGRRDFRSLVGSLTKRGPVLFSVGDEGEPLQRDGTHRFRKGVQIGSWNWFQSSMKPKRVSSETRSSPPPSFPGDPSLFLTTGLP